MSGDKLVFDLANEVEDTPNIFLRRDWVNILDNQNGNYNSNQSVIDTSQLSNSNKYMGYREGYLVVPMLLSMTSPTLGAGVMPNSATKSTEFAVGLKNWFGQIIHSLTLDFNGTTVIQQTPYINMWNSFKLMTSLSWQDVKDLGPTMGFYPDDPLSWTYQGAASLSGKGVCNNTNMRPPFNGLGPRVGITTAGTTSGGFGALGNNDNQYLCGLGNEGFLKRQLYIAYDSAASNGNSTFAQTSLSDGASNQLWKSRVITKTASTNAVTGAYQVAITATIHLRHLHSFFNQIPLIKGAFMKLTLNLNNTTTSLRSLANTGVYNLLSVQNSVGGVNPVMIASSQVLSVGATSAGADAVNINFYNGGAPLNKTAANATPLAADADYLINLSVGARCLNSSMTGLSESTLGRSVILYVPAYSFNSVFEQAYISNPIKKIMYEDVYQYQIQNIAANTGNINNLLTNGIANLRSVLILPFYSASETSDNSAVGHLAGAGIPVYQSPFDPAGTGPTSPLAFLSNFNVVVSGQNCIYNTEKYNFEQYINQTYGCNSVNAGLTDGLSSSLINQQGWEMEYCYYFVDVSRMLPVEQQVPKSVQIIGQNVCAQSLDLWCFLSYGCELSFDVVSGARV